MNNTGDRAPASVAENVIRVESDPATPFPQRGRHRDDRRLRRHDLVRYRATRGFRRLDYRECRDSAAARSLRSVPVSVAVFDHVTGGGFACGIRVDEAEPPG